MLLLLAAIASAAPEDAASDTRCHARLVRALTLPAMQGRGNGQPGLERAADLIDAAMDHAGLTVERQPFQVVVDRRGGGELRSTVAGESQPFGADDWQPTRYSGSGSFEGPLVRASSEDIVAGAPVAGAVVVLPPEYDYETLWRAAALAERHGAVAVVQGDWLGAAGPDRVPERGVPYAWAGIPVFTVGPAVGRAWHAWPDRVAGRVDVAPVEATVGNVIGTLPGRGELADEVVVIGAHYDHLGITDDGVVYPGADDNASGIAAVLCALPRIRDGRDPGSSRTVVAVAFAGEELGLYGSRWFVENPPPGRIVAMVNLDMVGTLADEALGFSGLDSAAGWAPIIARASGEVGVPVAPHPYEDSDHLAFLDAGIPAIHLFTGAGPQYHQPTDVPDLLDAEGAGRITRFAAAVAIALARDAALVPSDTCAADAWSGVRLEAAAWFTEVADGPRVVCVRPGGAGGLDLRAGDRVRSVDGMAVRTVWDFDALLDECEPATRVVGVTRDGVELELRSEGDGPRTGP
jgi:hypothetical protein